MLSLIHIRTIHKKGATLIVAAPFCLRFDDSRSYVGCIKLTTQSDSVKGYAQICLQAL